MNYSLLAILLISVARFSDGAIKCNQLVFASKSDFDGNKTKMPVQKPTIECAQIDNSDPVMCFMLEPLTTGQQKLSYGCGSCNQGNALAFKEGMKCHSCAPKADGSVGDCINIEKVEAIKKYKICPSGSTPITTELGQIYCGKDDKCATGFWLDSADKFHGIVGCKPDCEQRVINNGSKITCNECNGPAECIMPTRESAFDNNSTTTNGKTGQMAAGGGGILAMALAVMTAFLCML